MKAKTESKTFLSKIGTLAAEITEAEEAREAFDSLRARRVAEAKGTVDSLRAKAEGKEALDSLRVRSMVVSYDSDSHVGVK